MAYRIAFISLGCPKNQVDCELMIHSSLGAGYETTRRLDEADAIIVNTCSFIAPAIAEADGQIREARRYKEHGRCKAIIVAGCYPQYLQEKRTREYPYVDAWLTPDNPASAGAVLARLLPQADADVVIPAPDPPAQLPLPRFLASAADGRTLSTLPSYAYLKIAEGCDHRCSFCIIPQLRGTYRSRPLPDIVAEAGSLIKQGIPELILVSQDCSYYGSDSGGPGLLELLQALCAIPGDFWLRVLYLYPREFTDSELDGWAQLGPKLLPYFDIPIQHVNPRILRSMSRDGDRSTIDELFTRIKQRIPGAVLRTSLITGFPGETQSDHDELLAWVVSGIADRVGIFAYSDLPEMRSHSLEHHVASDSIELRLHQLVTAHTQACARNTEQLLGTCIPGVLESKRRLAHGAWLYYGRTWREAPGIDGILAVRSSGQHPLHQHCMIEITGVTGVDIEGIVPSQ